MKYFRQYSVNEVIMESWVPNPQAKPFVPQSKYRSGRTNKVTVHDLTGRRCIGKFFKVIIFSCIFFNLINDPGSFLFSNY